MSKKPSTAMPLTAKSTPAERETANRTHHQELISHTLDNAVAVGHGHAVGSGPTGKMVPNDSAFQGSAETSRSKPYIPQGVFAQDDTPQNRQSQSSRDGGAGFDDPSAKNYGTVDTGD
jgi:hypothetical protein